MYDLDVPVHNVIFKVSDSEQYSLTSKNAFIELG